MTTPGGLADAAVERMQRIQRALVRIRWFGVALGVYQIFWYQPNQGTVPPGFMKPAGGAFLALLAAENLLVTAWLRRGAGSAGLCCRIAFAADIAALWGITWVFTFEPLGATWVVLTILALEGAVLYQMRGALTPVLLALPLEIAREAYGTLVYGHLVVVSNITYRIGMIAIVGLVAGAMSRNLERERSEAERRAVLLAELAESEQQARRESAAFQEVILAGVSSPGLREALDSMLEHLESDLGYAKTAVLLVDEDERLSPFALRGFPSAVRHESVSLATGIAGAVARTGRSALVPDVSTDPRYHLVDPATRSQVTVPIVLGAEVIGVLDVESDRVDAFSDADRFRLERLSDQMALVIENARLLARERATVDRLRELDTMKSDFIAIASHELRTPITAMQGSVKTLLRPELRAAPEQAGELLAILERQSDRLAALVADLLLVSRIDAGAVSLRMEPTDVDEVLRDVLTDLGPRAARVSVALPASLGRVVTDGRRLEQVVRNLVDNALKFSPEDSAVRVSVHLDQTGLVIAVSDDGPGIPPEEAEAIFERFRQVGGSLRRRSEGFGLGLYIARRLTEALGGAITLESGAGRGSTFSLRVPAPPAEATAIRPA